MILLFPLRHPLTAIDLDVVGDNLHISLDIAGHHAGQLTIPADEQEYVILQLFANGARELGYLEDGEVHWIINPNLTGIEQVIDAFGNVHEVSKLKEAS